MSHLTARRATTPIIALAIALLAAIVMPSRADAASYAGWGTISGASALRVCGSESPSGARNCYTVGSSATVSGNLFYITSVTDGHLTAASMCGRYAGFRMNYTYAFHYYRAVITCTGYR